MELSELPHPTALGATRPSLVAGGASCFCVGTCTRRGHSGSRLRRRRPVTGGSECPTPTKSTLGATRPTHACCCVWTPDAMWWASYSPIWPCW